MTCRFKKQTHKSSPTSCFDKYPVTNKLTLISNWLNLSLKHNKIIWMPQELCHFKWFILLYKTHSTNYIEKKWQYKIKGQLFFSLHGQSNLWGLAIGFYLTKTHEIIYKTLYQLSRILLLEVKQVDVIFVLVNIYHENTEIQILFDLNNISKIM